MRKIDYQIKLFLRILVLMGSLNCTVFVFPQIANDLEFNIPSMEGRYFLDIEEVSRLAVMNNFDIQLIKYDMLIKRVEEGVSQSVYDTIIAAEINYGNDQRKRSSALFGTKTVDYDYDLKISKKLPSGTTVAIQDEYSKNRSNAAAVSLNPAHEAGVRLSIEQDLGRNFFGMQDRGNIKLTLFDIESSDYTSLDKIEGYLAAVQKAYWDIVLQKEILESQEQIALIARELWDIQLKKIQHRLIEYPELLAAEVNYKERLNAYLLARNQMERKANVLRLHLNIDRDQVNIVPVDSFCILKEDPQISQSLVDAFEHRNDYKEGLNVIRSKDLNITLQRANLWPEINVSVSLARNGLAGNFRDTVEQIYSEDNSEFRAGFRVTFSIENSEARSQFNAAQLEQARAIISLKQIERKIVVEVTDQVRDVNVFKELAKNSLEVATLQERKLEEERKRFKKGRSNTDTMIRYQNELAMARIVSAEAKYRYQIAWVELMRKQGRLLQAYWQDDF